jgi:hypothetical protein
MKTNNLSNLNLRTAFILSLSISLLMNMLFLTMFFYRNGDTLPENAPFRHIFRLDITLWRIFLNFLVAFLLYFLNFYLLKRKLFSHVKGKILVFIIIVFSTALISYLCSLVQMPFDDLSRLDVPPHPKAPVSLGDYFILEPAQFFRANRQYIIAHKAIKDVSLWFGGKLSVNPTIPTPERILVSKARAGEFKKWFIGLSDGN